MPVATQVGKGSIYGLATLAFGSLTGITSGYVSPKFETLTLTGQSQFDEEMAQTGEIDQLVGVNRGVKCQFRFKPRGTSLANANASCGIPDVATGLTISGLPVIIAHGFADVFNGLWIMTGEFTVEGTHTGLWTANITLGRYSGISSATPIT